jgi:hypothetical protein
MKICKICGIEKEETEFYFQSDRITLKPYCKSCNKRKSYENAKSHNFEYYKRPENVLKRREYESNPIQKEKRKIRFEERYKEKYSGYYKLWYRKYPEKIAAYLAGKEDKAEAGFNKHHWSYNEEHQRDYIMLDSKRHLIAHKHMIYDQERKMYRTLQGVLLDSKEDHINYINSLK